VRADITFVRQLFIAASNARPSNY